MLIPHVIFISIVSVGVHLAIMELIYTFYDAPENVYLNAKKWQTYLMKPLFYCPTCMASIWGTTLHFYFNGSLIEWPVVILAVAYFNTLLNKWVSN